MPIHKSLCFIVIVQLSLLVSGQSSKASYHLLKTVPLGAAAGTNEYFDYLTVDSSERRIYVAHGSEVKVLNADDFSIIGTIAGFNRSHGIAIVPGLNRGFITDGEAGSVSVFDTRSIKITKVIKTYPDADGILYDPASKFIFAFNGDSKNVSVIDPVKEVVVRTIPLGGGPEQPVSDGQGRVFDNNEERNDVVVIDTHTLSILKRWPVAPAKEPVAIAMDKERRRVFSASRDPSLLLMLDADTGKSLQSFPISAGVDGAVFDPESKTVFCSTRQGYIHIFRELSPNRLMPLGTIRTQYGAKTMTMDPKTHNLILTTADFTAGSNPRARRGTAHLLVYGQ
jgi:YVTN family beta-propeller protein